LRGVELELGQVFDTPRDWTEIVHQGEHSPCRVKIELFNPALRKKQLKSLAHVGSCDIHQIGCAQATILSNGCVLTGAVAGDVDRQSESQNGNPDCVNANQQHHFT
jgi:hypothetical protein